MKLTLERLKELLEYDPETGVFRWLIKSGSKSAGSIAGTSHKDGCCFRIMIDRKCYRSHILAWFYMTGEWPPSEIDHRNTIGTDNRWKNIRLSDRYKNMQNQRRAHRNSKTGLLGVHKCGGKYRARILYNGNDKSLGLHNSPQKAYEAYLSAKRKLHQGNTL